MNTIFAWVLLSAVVPVQSFQFSSVTLSCLKSEADIVRTAGRKGVQCLYLLENPARRLFVRNVLSVGFVSLFNVKESYSAPLSGADPADKIKLLEAIQTISDLQSDYQDPSKWQGIIKTLSQAPYTKESFEKLFTLAAKSLPPNIQKIYGGDGGQWVGLKTEAVDAMDAFLAELKYLEQQRSKGDAAPDMADLKGYYELLRSKSADFVALYSNKTLNATLKGVGFCAYSSSAKCDAFDDDTDVKASAKQGGIYNEFRYGSKERAVGGGVGEDSVTIRAYGQQSLLK